MTFPHTSTPNFNIHSFPFHNTYVQKLLKKKKKRKKISIPLEHQQNFLSTSSSSNNFPRINHPRPTSKPFPREKLKFPASKSSRSKAAKPRVPRVSPGGLARADYLVLENAARSRGWFVVLEDTTFAGSARCARYSASTLQDSIF